MSLSSALWTGTGIIHSLVGLAIPELREPLLRIVQEGTAEPSSGDMADRYEREAAFWFQMAGVMMVMQGWAWKQYVVESNRKELPRWWGWSLTLIGGIGATMMPKSGFWLVLAQGLRIVWKTTSSGDDLSTRKKLA